jgi:hypothetical protein
MRSKSYFGFQSVHDVFKEKLSQPLPVTFCRHEEMFVNVKLVYQQGVFHSVHHHADLR